jgi:hypothetical protein
MEIYHVLYFAKNGKALCRIRRYCVHFVDLYLGSNVPMCDK